MNDENNFGSGLPEDIDYTGSAPKMGAPTGVSAPVLDDIDYVAPSSKKDGPTGVSAPVLDDMDVYVPDSSKKGAPTGVSAPVLDSMDSYTPDDQKKGAPTGITAPVLEDNDYQSKPEAGPLVMSDDDIINGLTPDLRAKFDMLPADKQKQIIDMRRTQLGAVAPAPKVEAPVLDEDNYTPPPKKEEPPKPEAPISAPVLDDEPEAPKYVRQYVDEDLEKAKKEARKSVAASLAPDQKDSKKSLEMMLRLKEERQAEVAAKGFKVSIVLAIIGMISAICFYLLYSGQLGLAYKDELGSFASKVESLSVYIAVIVGLCSLSLLSGISGLKSLSSVVFLLFSFIQLFPGIGMIPQHEGSAAKVYILYIVALVGAIAVFITLSASESVGQYFKKEKVHYD